jgi:dolichol-phosphate mannosyltransferase
MSAQTTTPVHLRVRAGIRQPHNWLQLIRFAAVGASGYVVNLVTFTLLFHAVDLDYRVAATGAFLVAVTNNFLWNRRWTFRAHDGHRGGQAARFLMVSLLAFGLNLVILWFLVERLGIAEVPAQAAAIVAATPLSFVGNKLWSFAR